MYNMRISICLASYNGEKYIKEQLLSILPQLSEKDEVIISDDNSSDNTLGIVRGFDDKRIKIYINEGSHGVVSNFENAIKHASGDYIFLSDQDDIWLSNKKEKCLSCLQEYDFISHNAFIVDEHGVLSGKDYFSYAEHVMAIGIIYGKWGIWDVAWLLEGNV